MLKQHVQRQQTPFAQNDIKLCSTQLQSLAFFRIYCHSFALTSFRFRISSPPSQIVQTIFCLNKPSILCVFFWNIFIFLCFAVHFLSFFLNFSYFFVFLMSFFSKDASVCVFVSHFLGVLTVQLSLVAVQHTVIYVRIRHSPAQAVFKLDWQAEQKYAINSRGWVEIADIKQLRCCSAKRNHFTDGKTAYIRLKMLQNWSQKSVQTQCSPSV